MDGKNVELGTGRLGWTTGERHTERWGAVHLTAREDDPESYLTFPDAPIGTVGVLQAVIVEILWVPWRVDDPVVAGEEITLGTGELVMEMYRDIETIGVRPLDGRKEDWMDCHALYRCKNHRVRLEFIPQR